MAPGDVDQSSISVKPATRSNLELFVKHLIPRKFFSGY